MRVRASTFYGEFPGNADLLLVWGFLLAHADRSGFYGGIPKTISIICGLPIERVHAALAVFESPDPGARFAGDEGRRIRRLSNGWSIVNYAEYSAEDSRITKAEATAERTRRWRKRKRERVVGAAASDTPGTV